jgi:hypothetical protein
MRAALLLCVLAACGDNTASTVDASLSTTVSDTFTLAPGYLIEGSWTAGPSDQIGLSITADGLFDYDIHGHQGGGTQDIDVAFAQPSVTYTFVPTQEAQWYLLLRNSSAATLTFTMEQNLYDAAVWNGWQPQ